ncbi:uncharacterized protein DS421_18g614060 [Arachis hypogaea]|nr:uncharacterized protein DS421_18g614060 [Arachis hypogaea]
MESAVGQHGAMRNHLGSPFQKSLEILATTTQRVGLILVVIAIVTLCAIAWMDLYQVTSKIRIAIVLGELR